MIVVMISVPSHDAGLRTVNSVGAASLEGRILVEDIAMVHRTDDGEVEVHRSAPSPENRRIIGDGTQGPLAGLFSAPLAPAVAVGARAPTATRTTRAGRAIRLSGATAFLLVDEASTLTMEQAGQAMRGSGAVVFVVAEAVVMAWPGVEVVLGGRGGVDRDTEPHVRDEGLQARPLTAADGGELSEDCRE